MTGPAKTAVYTVSVREFRANLAEALRRVADGGRVVVTNAGIPVAELGAVRDGEVETQSGPKTSPRGRQRGGGLGTPPADALGQLRWLQEAQLRAVAGAPDERTRTGAAKEARALTEKIGRITGELREIDAGELARYERMQPGELLEAIEALAAELREAIDG